MSQNAVYMTFETSVCKPTSLTRGPTVVCGQSRRRPWNDGTRIMLKVGLIVGSTRPNRFADAPVQWLVEGASARPDLRLTVLLSDLLASAETGRERSKMISSAVPLGRLGKPDE